jgi:galactokinase
MTGGGFGGCVIGLLAGTEVPAAADAVRAAFIARRFAEPHAFLAAPVDGAHRVVGA